MKFVYIVTILFVLSVPGYSFGYTDQQYRQQRQYHATQYLPPLSKDYERYTHNRRPPYHYEQEDREQRYYRQYNEDRYGNWDDDERYFYQDDRDRKKRRYREAVPGWDIAPHIARNANNCYHYRLTVRNGRGSARICELPGKNYIQTNSEKSGYVCFTGRATLELGKLTNPGIEVTFQLKGIGQYVFSGGDKGTRYQNNWYRAFWQL